MASLLLFIFALYQLQASICSEVLNTPKYNINALSESGGVAIPLEVDALDDNEEKDGEHDELPFVKSGNDQTEVEFRHPISAVNIDYSKNMITLRFRKERKLSAEEEEKRRSIEHNFMRFGRSGDDFMRFGKRNIDDLHRVNNINRGYADKGPKSRSERSEEGMRDSRADNFMRFGRASSDFMRFGRSDSDFMRFGRSPSAADYMRFGRSGSNDFMRFGRDPKDFMRFGRGSDDFMRFGRKPQKSGKELRQADKNFMRFGRPDNFMRFGRTSSSSLIQNGNGNNSQPLVYKNISKNTTKLGHDNDESNPRDKAMKLMYDKQQQQQQQQKQTHKALDETNVPNNDELDSEMEYDINALN